MKPQDRTKRAERAERAIALREQGATLKQVGTALGVSVERARQIIANHRRWQRKAIDRPAMLYLSSRVISAIRLRDTIYGPSGVDIDRPEAVAAYGEAQLRSLSGVGDEAVKEVRNWLKRKHNLTLAA
jgi:hypothetical protein